MDKDFVYFPYDDYRKGQKEFIEKVYQSIIRAENILVQAPTGLGKTVSGLSPALRVAKDKDFTIIYLTSRQTQINQVLKTLNEISQKHNLDISSIGFVGKRNMCVHKGKEVFFGTEFNDFCQKQKEYGKCKFFTNIKKEEKEKYKNKIIKNKSLNLIEDFIDECNLYSFCPYEIASLKAFKCDIVVCDFNYLFSKSIRENFLGKIGKNLDELIVIVDEAHNLPDRVRNMYSNNLSIDAINRALKEERDVFKKPTYDHFLRAIKTILEDLEIKNLKNKEEAEISKDEFIFSLEQKFRDDNFKFDNIVDKLREAELSVKESKIISYIGRIANFLEHWNKTDKEGYLRIINKKIAKNKNKVVSLDVKNLDPGQIISDILNQTQSSVLMSATLTPLDMYRDILGLKNANLLELDTPFLQDNLGVYRVDDVSTKYSLRGEDMYKKYADYIRNCILSFQRNVIVFFPSYVLLDKILNHFGYKSLDRNVFRERPGLSKEEKEKIVHVFKNSREKSVLFGVTSGSFAEGLDLPEEALEIVLVVGLPLPKPDLLSDKLIEVYDRKFQRGRDYGYIFPAMAKIVQAGGRCIRTQNDRGILLLMDNRFKWPIYTKVFPKFWKIKRFFGFKEIENFFLQDFKK